MPGINGRRVVGSLRLLLILVGAGCGGQPAQNDAVEGTIKIDGIPLAGVMVQFVPEGKDKLPGANAVTDEKGHYKLESDNNKPGAVIGKHRVLVLAGRDAASRQGDPQAAEPAGNAPAISPSKKNPPIPTLYSTVGKTPLTVDVTADQHVYDLNLTSAGR